MTNPTDTDTQEFSISVGLQQLVKRSGENSKAHGFHEDWPKPAILGTHSVREVERRSQERGRAIAEKLALVHEEVSEALGEIRSGRHPLDTYFVDHKGAIGTPGVEFEQQQYDANGTPLCKPEGFLVELADAIIRIADLAFLAGDPKGTRLAAASAVKHEYNVSREHKHGRKF